MRRFFVIFLFILLVLSVIMFIYFLCIKSGYFLPFLALTLILTLITLFSFYGHTIRTNRKLKEILLEFDATPMMQKKEDGHHLYFEKSDDRWVCPAYPVISFDLSGYLFPKSYILAWIIRNLRYPTISRKLPQKRIMSFYCPVKRFHRVTVHFDDNGKQFQYVIVNNGVSKNTWITKKITEANYSSYFHSQYFSKELNRVTGLNEVFYHYEI